MLHALLPVVLTEMCVGSVSVCTQHGLTLTFCSPATVASGFPNLLATQHFHWP